MNTQQIRAAYLEFFKDRGHTVIPRAKVVPENDPSTLFTGSGMQPMIPYLLGETHPHGVRLADSQTCLRAQDIDEVGDNRHTTFFEMLGNWSLGDYFKEEQIPWMFEFLTTVVGLDPAKLYVTCFIGAPEYDIPKDEVAAKIWQKLFKEQGIEATTADIGSEADGYKRGITPGERIFYYDGSKNWWSRNGSPETTPVGDPCGPDSEMFYDFGTPHNAEYGEHCHPNCDCGRFMEIGNNVFMAYRKEAEGKFVPLDKPNIDHGSGLERIAAAAIHNPDVFKISVMWPIIETIQTISRKNYDDNQVSMRVIADHLRAATFMAVDGIVPSNKQQGYVMRRLVRRAMVKAFALGIEQNFLQQIIPVIAGLYRDDFPEVAAGRDEIIAVLTKEENAFRSTLRKGLKTFEKIATQQKSVFGYVGSDDLFETKDLLVPVLPNNQPIQWIPRQEIVITGSDIFMLGDTYGFPLALSIEQAEALNLPIAKDWESQQHVLMEQQRNRSQTAAKGVFKGGLGGQTEQHKKYHTATHLMYQSLRTVLGDHVIQHGSNITEERLRFDFSHPDKMTPEQISQVEAMVNTQIAADLTVTWEEHPTRQAIDELHVLGAFGDRYGDVVKCYRMQAPGADKPFSFEICGGPHVDHTAQLAEPAEGTETPKKFKILKEESSSSGIRRIKAVLA